jgi:hypothetical protein
MRPIDYSRKLPPDADMSAVCRYIGTFGTPNAKVSSVFMRDCGT